MCSRACSSLATWVDTDGWAMALKNTLRQAPDVIVLQGRYSEHAIDEIPPLKKYFSARRIFELDDYVIDVPHRNAHIASRLSGGEYTKATRLQQNMRDHLCCRHRPFFSRGHLRWSFDIR